MINKHTIKKTYKQNKLKRSETNWLSVFFVYSLNYRCRKGNGNQPSKLKLMRLYQFLLFEWCCLVATGQAACDHSVSSEGVLNKYITKQMLFYHFGEGNMNRWESINKYKQINLLADSQTFMADFQFTWISVMKYYFLAVIIDARPWWARDEGYPRLCLLKVSLSHSPDLLLLTPGPF